MTDANGQLYEHMQYFPFGETWVQEHSNRLRTPYLFTGKELDQETGLYYFGARYYDSRTSVWQSVDPILEKYLPTGDKEHDARLSGMGGVFNSLNLHLLGYVGQNPLTHVDPDGKELVRAIFAGNSAFIGRELIVDSTFVPALVAMNELALERGIKIDAQQLNRVEGATVKGAVVQPAKKSNHLLGRAVDFNLIDKDGKRYSHAAKNLLKGKMSKNIEGFISDVKAIQVSTKIDRKNSPRWGGDFRKTDEIHFDLATSDKARAKLLKENQAQYKSGNIKRGGLKSEVQHLTPCKVLRWKNNEQRTSN